MRRDLLRWQWEGYPRFHRDRLNLAIHVLAVPAFVAGAGMVAGGLWALSWPTAASGALIMAGAFAAQAVGHAREENPAIPFDGPVDAVTRIAAEQFVTFWRFLASGLGR
jgi:hypothetical protein